MPEITCPGCGTVSHLDQVRRSAEEFCRRCDYPLFWVRTTGFGDDLGLGGDDDTGLRRLPGTAGRVAVAQRTCWSCNEPNVVTATVCIRCGVDLSGPPTLVEEPAPPPPPPPPPPPEPEPEPVATRPWWIWLVVALVMVAILAAVWVAGS